MSIGSPELLEEHQKLQDGAIEFAQSELGKDIIRRDREEEFSREDWKKCANFGVLGMPVPREYGGMGLGITEVIAVMEGLGYGTSDQGLLFSINAHMWTSIMPISLYGTPEQKQFYLPRLSNGEWISANAASEPEAGSDVFSMRTRAERRGDHYVLNGTKTFVTNAQVADLFVAYATIDPRLGSMGITGFILERSTPGIVISKPLEKMGLRTSPMAEVVFDECKVPLSNRLGREGRGVAVFESSMEWERGCILANYLGLMKRQLERAIHYAQNRKQFGKTIGKFQSVANRIVNMKVRLDTCRQLVYRIGWLKEHGKPAMLEAAVAKLHVSESLVANCQDAIQIFGGYGYMVEQQIERELRDAVGSTLYSGTTEIQRNLIARCLGL
ncbi:MAG TPA: acyl-CoA dehydrogenase family protein [Candidatus Sulfotelmatobacter sp.]|nr:acyl-CoA dehydrogenase family protein [Candidatus Sulfotelmatobacter sp.]